MEKTKIEIIKLVPSEGMVLTNGETYSTEVYLGKNDSADNWYEITQEAYDVILEEERQRESLIQ